MGSLLWTLAHFSESFAPCWWLAGHSRYSTQWKKDTSPKAHPLPGAALRQQLVGAGLKVGWLAESWDRTERPSQAQSCATHWLRTLWELRLISVPPSSSIVSPPLTLRALPSSISICDCFCQNPFPREPDLRTLPLKKSAKSPLCFKMSCFYKSNHLQHPLLSYGFIIFTTNSLPMNDGIYSMWGINTLSVPLLGNF